MKPDIFDILSPDENEDVFQRVDTEESAVDRIKKEVLKTLDSYSDKEIRASNKRLTEEIKDFIRSEIAKIKPVQNVIERQVEQITKTINVPVHLEPKVIRVPPPPPQIVKEVRVEVKQDTSRFADMDTIRDLKNQISDLQKKLEKVQRTAESPLVIPGGPGGAGVIGIPPPEAATIGNVLTVGSDGKAKWSTGGGGADISGYTVNDATQLKNLPADASLDDLRQVLGTLLTELQA